MTPIARKDDLLVQECAGELLVYDYRSEKAFCLNPSSAIVWQKCDGKKSTTEIAREMEQEIGLSVSEDIVWYALNRLSADCLLESQLFA